VKAYNSAEVVRQSSNRWEGNAEYTTNTKTAGSERGPNKAEALVQKKEDGNTFSDTANGANLSGKPYLVNAYNSPAVVRQSSNRWEGNAEYTTNTKTAGSERGPNKAEALVQKQINPNAPTGLVPQKVDQQYDGIQQLKKPLNFANQKESDDYKDTYNADKKPDPGAYA